MADKIAQIDEFTREQFFPSFVKYLHETQHFVVTEERKPNSIRFSMLPIVKEGVIELRAAGKGFDVYVDMALGSMHKLNSILKIAEKRTEKCARKI